MTNVLDFVKKWGSTGSLVVAFLGAFAAGAIWFYRVDEMVRKQAKTNEMLWEIKKRQDVHDAFDWAFLYWARQVSKQEDWPEPPTILGTEKPSGVKTPAPYWPGMYATERVPE